MDQELRQYQKENPVKGKAFTLNSPFTPSGDQPGAIQQLIEGLHDGLLHQTLLGVTGSGKTFTIANIIAKEQRPALILAPNKTLAAQLYGEMRELFPKIPSSILFLTMTIISPRPTSLRRILTFKRMLRSTNILSKCDFQQPKP